uniref:Metallo-beta-lactamase domain-containing protein n=1 Tax=Plectus sambesii TaxID=2011161 RepID=A0A914WIV3_9BILA
MVRDGKTDGRHSGRDEEERRDVPPHHHRRVQASARAEKRTTHPSPHKQTLDWTFDLVSSSAHRWSCSNLTSACRLVGHLRLRLLSSSDMAQLDIHCFNVKTMMLLCMLCSVAIAANLPFEYTKKSASSRWTRDVNPPEIISDSNTFDIFEPRPDPEKKKFVMVHLPMPDPRLGPATGPVVIPLIFGDLRMESDHFKFSSTAIVVRDGKDGKCDIMVDTGLAMYKNTIIGGLAAHGMRPSDIENVILTHGDIDNTGNLNLFLDAQVYSANRKIQRDNFFAQQVAPSFDREGVQLPMRPLCNNTDIYLTPGYSPTDLSLIVRNVQNFGTIAIVGNLIMNEADSTDSEIWQQFSHDSDMQMLWQATRNEIFCLADYIVPGHGEMFRVNPDMKATAGCGKASRQW